MKQKQKEQAIINYKASAYVFTQFVLRAEADVIIRLAETKEYKEMVEAASVLVEHGIKIK